MDDEATEDIMEATYRALCACGYADLTMQAIADESARSKAALHYHYGTKHDLLVAFLDYLFESFADRLDDADGDDPEERFVALVDAVLSPRSDRAFGTAVLEIEAQAPYDDAFRERLAEFDRLIHDRARSILADGIERGVFRDDLDPDETASFVVTVCNGAFTRRVATDHSSDATRRRLVEHVSTTPVADEPGAAAE